MEDKTNFSRRLQLGSMEKFDGLTGLTLSPHILRQICATDPYHGSIIAISHHSICIRPDGFM